MLFDSNRFQPIHQIPTDFQQIPYGFPMSSPWRSYSLRSRCKVCWEDRRMGRLSLFPNFDVMSALVWRKSWGGVQHSSIICISIPALIFHLRISFEGRNILWSTAALWINPQLKQKIEKTRSDVAVWVIAWVKPIYIYIYIYRDPTACRAFATSHPSSVLQP